MKNSHDWLYHNQSVDFLLSVQVLGRADSHRLFRRLDEMLKLDMHSLVFGPSETFRSPKVASKAFSTICSLGFSFVKLD